MGIRTREQYIESLRRQKPKIYMEGKEVKDVADNPCFRVGINNIATSFDVVNDPKYRDIAVIKSPLINEDISLWTHIPQSAADTIAKVKLMMAVGENLCPCCYRCMTTDNLIGAWTISYEIDKKCGTNYHERVKEITKEAQRNDLVIGAASVDAKGDRSKGPSQQADPDFYLHIVERRKDGVVVRGAKPHVTAGPYTNMLCQTPPPTLTEADKDYAIGFFTPIDAKGITFVARHPPAPDVPPEIESPYSSRYGGHVEAFTVFDNVFVPWERVFMCGEWEFARQMRRLRTPTHSMHKCICRRSSIDLSLGAAALIADYNGVEDAPNIQDAITEMMMDAEIAYACALGAAVDGWKHESGAFIPKASLASTGKAYASKKLADIHYYMQDAAGGAVVTMPSEKDYRNPATAKFMEKYYKGREGVPTEHRIRAIKLIEDLIASPYAGWYRGMAISGGSPPRAHKGYVRGSYDLDRAKQLAKLAAGILKEDKK